jgi:two-component system response regulator AtoC
MLKALLVDDDLAFVLGLADAVAAEGFVTRTAASLAEARSEIAKDMPDLLLVDLQLPDGNGMDLVKTLEAVARPEILFMTAHASIETAIEALRLGVADYLTKPVDFARIKMALANLHRTRELREEIGSLRGELRQLGRFGQLVGGAPLMQQLYDLIAKVAPTEVTALILGETGTGKEVVAETIHRLSRRRRSAFVPVNCGAVPGTLIESELFGHERGSFTGADRVHKGFFERASGGTLFLDEITEMPVALQVRLLRVLETGSVVRVGGSQPIRVDVRVIAASNRRLDEAVAGGSLREDLMYRLNVFPLELPPLRQRKEDIELLAEHFLDALNAEHGTAKRLSQAALDRLRLHSWPGNVRELRNVVQRAFILAEGDIRVATLPLGTSEEAPGSDLGLKVGNSVAETERRLILATLEHCEGDKRRTAEILKISLRTLYNRLREYEPGVDR